MRGWSADRWIATGTGALALWFMWSAWNLPRFRLTTVIDAHVFPLVVGAAMFAFSVLLWVQSGARRREASVAWAGMDLRRGALLAILTLLYIVVLEPLGYLLSTFVFLLLAPAALGWRRWWVSAVVALLFAGGTYYLFSSVLLVPLPRGILPL